MGYRLKDRQGLALRTVGRQSREITRSHHRRYRFGDEAQHGGQNDVGMGESRAEPAFRWAVRDGQFDDLDTPPLRVLTDDVPPPSPAHGEVGR